jgi:hypothetical protein
MTKDHNGPDQGALTGSGHPLDDAEVRGGHMSIGKAHAAPLREGHREPTMMQGTPPGPPPPYTPGSETVAQPPASAESHQSPAAPAEK